MSGERQSPWLCLDCDEIKWITGVYYTLETSAKIWYT